MKKLNLNAIKIDGGTQARVSLNEATVAEYVECLEALPPVVVFFDGSEHWLADGFHRLHAYRLAGKASIPADVRPGTRREAILHSLGANRAHGLRVTNADKRKAVQTMLDDEEWAAWSDRKIAEACGVGHPFVAALRRPEVAQKQQEKRAASASKKAAGVESDSTRKPEPKQPKRTLEAARPADVQAPDAADNLAEAQHTITELAQENEQLRDKLAVESLMDSEDAKTQTAETIRDLRALVKTLEAENAALKIARDTYQREAGEAKKSAIYWRKQAEKAAKDAA